MPGATRRLVKVTVGAAEIGPDRSVVVRFKRGLVGIETGGKPAKVDGNFQQTRHAAPTHQAVRAPLPMTIPSQATGIHPAMPSCQFDLNSALRARVQFRWLTGEPVGVEFGFPFSRRRRAIGFFDGGFPHFLPAKAFLMLKPIPFHDCEVELMRGQDGRGDDGRGWRGERR